MRVFMPAIFVLLFCTLFTSSAPAAVSAGKRVEYELVCTSPCPEVYIDGKYAGESGKVQLEAGRTYTLEYKLSGHQSRRAELTVTEPFAGVKRIPLVSPVMKSNPEGVDAESVAAQAALEMRAKISPRTRTAFVNTSKDNSELTAYILDSLLAAVSGGTELLILDRDDNAALQAERKLQQSADISDKTIAAIGRQLGAQTIVSCSVVGSGALRRLSLKAVDVATAQIQFIGAYNI
ncbi:MAG: penicillin-binding protein activator LpoB [Deltaproteobacteria bacterium]|jgi:hypothetical protein|nr:penicillin-binding protein activator LpoB [Deltaproteobacteria bacterium]